MENEQSYFRELQPGMTLQDGKYIIERVLGAGGFGITYLAKDNSLGVYVAVKEFFMKDLCSRDEATQTMNSSRSTETKTVLSISVKKSPTRAVR